MAGLSDGLVVFKTVAVTGHIDDFTMVNQAVKDSSGNGGVTEERGPLIEAFVGGDDEGGSLGEIRDKGEEEIGFHGFEGHETDFIDNDECGLVEIGEAAFGGGGKGSGFEDGHEGGESFKGDTMAQIKSVSGEGEGKMGFTDAGGTEETDVESLFHPGQIVEAEHLFFGNRALKAEVEGIKGFLVGEIGALATELILLFRAQALLFQEEQFHGVQGGKVIAALKEDIEVQGRKPEIVG